MNSGIMTSFRYFIRGTRKGTDNEVWIASQS